MGLVFDHGCDAFGAGMWFFMFAKMMNIGNSALILFALPTVYACFHFATLEEYYMGILRLPVCNGVSDGSVFMILFMIFTGIIGPEFWTQSPCESECGSWLNMNGVSYLTWGQILILAIIVSQTFVYIGNWYKTIRTASNPCEHQTEPFACGQFLIQVTAFAIFTATWIIMGFVGSNSMMQQTIDPYLLF
jgi:hypothetical protein